MIMSSKKSLIFGLLAGLGIVLVIAAIALFASAGSFKSEVSAVQEPKQPAEKVEVFLFHTTQRCTTCIAIGRLAGETVNEYFQPEIKAGRIEFREINIDLAENKKLAEKFQASGSSLFLNAISDGKDNITEDITVWRLTQNSTQFKNYLKGKINNLLGK